LHEGRPSGVRLFVPPARLSLPRQTLSSDDQRYLFRVRRLKAGDVFEVFDGHGGRHRAVVDPGMETASVGPRQVDSLSAGLTVELWQGIPKGDKLDLIIQKATELGVARIVPFTAQRSVPRVARERLAGRMARWQRIAAEAARQCGRSDVPEVAEPRDFAAFLARAAQGIAVGLVYEGSSERSLWGFLSSLGRPQPVILAIGPEGGFAPAEIDDALVAGVPLLSMGARILRTETAALVACTLALAVSGAFD